jgi:C_GCAxxG_C_C family probable redox protein
MSRVDIALKRFDAGFNCAQSVLSAFAEDLGLKEETSLLLASAFGGGMRMAATCGALTGALMALGLAQGFDNVDVDKKAHIENLTRELVARWTSSIGDTDCKDILGIDVSKPEGRAEARAAGVFDRECPRCIEQGVTLLEDLLAGIA